MVEGSSASETISSFMRLKKILLFVIGMISNLSGYNNRFNRIKDSNGLVAPNP